MRTLRIGTVRLPELGLWLLLLLTGATLKFVRCGEPLMGNDSYQYLSVAENLLYRHDLSTSLVHYDVERSSGRIPAPCTTFPVGYPILIAVVSFLGFSLPFAAMMISLLSATAIVPLLCIAASDLSISLPLTRICLFLWVINSYTVAFSVADLSESVFTLFSFSAIVLVLSHESLTDNSGKGWQIVAAFVLVGMAYWVRYVGLFLFGALVLYGLVQAFALRRSIATWLGSMIAGAGIMAAGALRNILIAGTWKGGPINNPHHSPWLVARAFVKSLSRLFFGDAPVHLGTVYSLAEVAVGIGTLGLLAGWMALLVSGGMRARISARLLRPVSVLFIYSIIYSAGMYYLGVVTPIGFNFRMFLPLLPVFLISIVTVWSLVTDSEPHPKVWHRLAWAVFLVGYGAMNVQNIWMPYTSPHQTVSAWLEMPMDTGQPLTAWIRDNIADESVIVSEDGQATGYVLHRKTISLVPPVFSRTLWNDTQIQKVMQSFNAEYLLVYTAPENDELQQHNDSPFLKYLADGSAPPWLFLAAENPRIRVFRRRF